MLRIRFLKLSHTPYSLILRRRFLAVCVGCTLVLPGLSGCELSAPAPAGGTASGTPGSPASPTTGGTAEGTPVDAPPQSAELKRLRELDVDFMTGDGGIRLTNDTVSQVRFIHSKFTANDVDLLLVFPNVKSLDFWKLDNPINDDAIEKLQPLKKLKMLRLTAHPITNAGLAHLEQMPELEDLWLDETKVTDDGLKHLAACPKIWRLSLEGTGTTDGCIKHLKNLSNLRLLFAARTNTTRTGAADLKAALPNCQIEGR